MSDVIVYSGDKVTVRLRHDGRVVELTKATVADPDLDVDELWLHPDGKAGVTIRALVREDETFVEKGRRLVAAVLPFAVGGLFDVQGDL